MTIDIINPYLRFAMSFKYPKRTDMLIAYDTHIYYINSGEGEIISDKSSCNFKKGSVILVPSGIPYLFVSQGMIDCISINFDYTNGRSDISDPISPVEISEYDLDRLTEDIFFQDHTFLNNITVFSGTEHLLSAFERIENEFLSKKQLFHESASADLKKIIIELLRIQLIGASSFSKVNGILDYIKEHFYENLTNGLISEVFGYHPYHLNRILKSSIGTTLHQYLINYRMEMAKKYLSKDEMSVLEVSRLCGYNNFSNFSCDFKKRCGYSPLKYREISKNR